MNAKMYGDLVVIGFPFMYLRRAIQHDLCKAIGDSYLLRDAKKEKASG